MTRKLTSPSVRNKQEEEATTALVYMTRGRVRDGGGWERELMNAALTV